MGVSCMDHDEGCKGWAAATGGKLCESEEDKPFMLRICPASCGICTEMDKDELWASLGVHVSLLYPLVYSRLGRRSLEAREITRGDHAARDTGYPLCSVLGSRSADANSLRNTRRRAGTHRLTRVSGLYILIELGPKAPTRLPVLYS